MTEELASVSSETSSEAAGLKRKQQKRLPFALLQPKHTPVRQNVVAKLLQNPTPEEALQELRMHVEACSLESPLVVDLETRGNRPYLLETTVVGVGFASGCGRTYLNLKENDGLAVWQAVLLFLYEQKTPLMAHNVFFDMSLMTRDLNLLLNAGKYPEWFNDWNFHNFQVCTYAAYKHVASEGWPGQSWGLKGAMQDVLLWEETNEQGIDRWLVENGLTTRAVSKADMAALQFGGWDAFSAEKREDLESRADKGEMWQVPADILGSYCLLDVEATWLLWDTQLKPLFSKFNVYNDFHRGELMNLECLLIVQMLMGIKINEKNLNLFRSRLLGEVSAARAAFLSYPAVAEGVKRMNLAVVEGEPEPEHKFLRGPKPRPEPAKYKKNGEVSKTWLNWQEHEKKIAEYNANPEPTAQYTAWLARKAERLRLLENFAAEDEEACKEAGLFNLGSSDQKRVLFYDILGFEVKVWTMPEAGKEPQPSTDSDAMQGFGEAGKLYLEYAEKSKTLQMVCSMLEVCIAHANGGPWPDGEEEWLWYHPQVKVPGTLTGRLGGAGGVNCFPDGTDVLTQRGWVDLANLQPTDVVMQVTPEGKQSFTQVTAYIEKEVNEDLVSFQVGRNSILCTENHRMLLFPEYQSKKDAAYYVVEAGSPMPKPRMAVLPVGEDSHTGDIVLSSEDIWKLCAIQADGHRRPDRPNVYVVGVKKERKLEKLTELFGEKTNCYDGVHTWSYIKFSSPCLTEEKRFDLTKLSTACVDVFLQALAFWDGNQVKNGGFEFTSAHKENADQVQAYLARAGRVSRVAAYTHKSNFVEEPVTMWRVYVGETRKKSTAGCVGRVPYKGTVRCVSVPSGFIVVRQNGDTVVVGNCQNPVKDKDYLSCWLGRGQLVDYDFTALEPVALTELSRDSSMLKLYGPGAKTNDVYLFSGMAFPGIREQFAACGYDPNDPTPEAIKRCKKEHKGLRQVCKIAELSAKYGAGAKKWQASFAMSGFHYTFQECKTMHQSYWALYGGIKKFEQHLVNMWEQNGGWILNGIGRPICVDKSYIKDIVNRCIQSSGHDLLMVWLNIMTKQLREANVRYRPWLADFHDEAIYDAHILDVNQVKEIMGVTSFVELNDTMCSNSLIKLKGDGGLIDSLADAKCEE